MTFYPRITTRRYDIQRRKVSAQWDLVAGQLHELAPTLKAINGGNDYDERPWNLIRDMNALSHDYLLRDPVLNSAQIALAQASFDVALNYDRVECAADFLQLLPAPDAVRIIEFLHHVRLALQWGTFAVERVAIEKWLDCAEKAIDRCPNFNVLSAGQRFNVHEVMMGRVVKLGASLQGRLRSTFLANLAGRAEDDDIEGLFCSEDAAVNVVYGEMTLTDLRERVQRSARMFGADVAAVSILVSENAVSYVAEGSRSVRPISLADHVPAPGIGASLRRLLKKRNKINFDRESLDDSIHWPHDLRVLFRSLAEHLLTPGQPYSYMVLTVNMPYQGLPWQHLVASATGFGESIPCVTIMPNFGILIAMLKAQAARAEPKLVWFPRNVRTVKDPDISAALQPVSRQLAGFWSKPRFSLGYVTAHGVNDDTANADDIAGRDTELAMPRFMLDVDVTMEPEQLAELLTAEVVYLAVCGAGAFARSFFKDVGGLLSPFLMQQRGLMIAPIADVAPETAARLGASVLASANRDTVIKGYVSRLRQAAGNASLREAYLFNAYGLPMADMLA